MSWRPSGFPVHCCISRVMCLLFFFLGGGNLLNSSSSYKGLAMSGGRAKTCQNCGRGCKGHHLKNHASIPGSATTLSGHETLYSLIFLVLYVFVFFLASFPGKNTWDSLLSVVALTHSCWNGGRTSPENIEAAVRFCNHICHSSMCAACSGVHGWG